MIHASEIRLFFLSVTILWRRSRYIKIDDKFNFMINIDKSIGTYEIIRRADKFQQFYKTDIG